MKLFDAKILINNDVFHFYIEPGKDCFVACLDVNGKPYAVLGCIEQKDAIQLLTEWLNACLK
ncbi:MAG: hypothetical protein M0R77_07720 [Gammaproteobacteria bacterium]|nr:hypothetical protein [Gammaproteobacteria bacterium]